METIVEHVDVWAANIEDKPGASPGCCRRCVTWALTCNSSLPDAPR